MCFISSSSSEGSLHINDETTPPPMHGRDTGSRRYRDLEGVQDGEYGRNICQCQAPLVSHKHLGFVLAKVNCIQ